MQLRSDVLMSCSTQDTPFRRHSFQSISWLGIKELSQTQQKQTCLERKLYYNTE